MSYVSTLWAHVQAIAVLNAHEGVKGWLIKRPMIVEVQRRFVILQRI
jgi:hypothetical protein